MMTELSRSLQPRHIAMISIGGIVGAGLFVGSSAAIHAAGPAIVLSYLITGGLVLLVMRMLGEMAVALPQLRSFTEFPRAGLGPWAGFVAGWLYWYFWVVTVPVEAIAGANILHAWMPTLPTLVVGLGLMAVMTGVNLMSARSYGEFEFWFSSIKVAAIIAFIALVLPYAFGWTSPHGATFGNLTSHGGFMPYGIVAVLSGAVTVFFSLTGAEITTVAAAESAEPTRAVARMSTSVIVRILTFYVASVFLIVSVVPWDSVKVGESPFALTLTSMGFGWAGMALSVVILTAVLSCLNSAFYVCSRVLFVLAEHGDAPKGLVRINSRKVPVNSVWISAFAGVLGVIADTQAHDTVFGLLVNDAGAIIVFVYMMVAAAQIRLRREREAAGEAPPAVRMWLFPWASYAAIAAMIGLLVAMHFTSSARDLHVSLVTLGVTCLAYVVVRAWRGTAVRSPAA
jgi:GABA permease